MDPYMAANILSSYYTACLVCRLQQDFPLARKGKKADLQIHSDGSA